MPIKYKIDVMAALKEKGYSTYRLRKEKLIGESYLTQIRRGDVVSWDIIERLCVLLQCDVGDLVTVVEDSAPDQ